MKMTLVMVNVLREFIQREFKQREFIQRPNVVFHYPQEPSTGCLRDPHQYITNVSMTNYKIKEILKKANRHHQQKSVTYPLVVAKR